MYPVLPQGEYTVPSLPQIKVHVIHFKYSFGIFATFYNPYNNIQVLKLRLFSNIWNSWWSHFSVQNIESLNLLSSNLDPFFDHCNQPHNNSFSLPLPASIQWFECVHASLLWGSPWYQLFVCSLFWLPQPLFHHCLVSCFFSVVLLFCDWTLEGETTKEKKIAVWKKTRVLFLLLSFLVLVAFFVLLLLWS